jgi:hypothetical protein
VGSQVTLSVSIADTSINGQYVITWSDTPVLDHGESVVLNRGYLPNEGLYSAQLTIPESPCGNYFICFLPENTDARANYQFNLQPDFSLNQSSAKPGDSIQLKGTGFPANERVLIYLNDLSLDVNVIANQKGSFYQPVKIPSIDPGQYKLVAANGNRGISKSVEIQILPVKTDIKEDVSKPDPPVTIPVPQEVTDTFPPAAPLPISPIGEKIGYFGDQTITFKWSDVADSGGVRYSMEILKDPEAKETVLRVKDLKENYFISSVQPGIYYWRVKAVDGAGNESDWYSAGYSFEVAEGSVLWSEFSGFLDRTKVFIIMLWAVGIYILASLVLFLIRKMNKWQNR